MWKVNGVLLALLLANACESETDEQVSAEREACTEMCALVACQGDVESQQIADCADRCMDKRKQAAEQGVMCETANSRSIDCFKDLECEQYLAWEGGDNTICESQLQAFEDNCGELTFEFRP